MGLGVRVFPGLPPHVWETLCGFVKGAGYDLFGSAGVSQMKCPRLPEVLPATWPSLHVQGGLVMGLAGSLQNKQVRFLPSATARPPATNYSISFLATRG